MSIGIVTACMDRHENLLKVLPNWLELEVNEIIIVDWSSRVAIKELISTKIAADKRIKVIRVDGEKEWILTHAYNLGFKYSKSRFIAKLDCDHIVSSEIFKSIALKEYELYRFNHFTQDSGINGAFIICSKLLNRVNSFDERIVTYGFDETDLFRRASEHAKVVIQLEERFVCHLIHDKNARTINQSNRFERIIAQKLCIDLHEFMVIYNECATSSRIPWGPSHQSRWRLLEDGTNIVFEENTDSSYAKSHHHNIVILFASVSKACQISKSPSEFPDFDAIANIILQSSMAIDVSVSKEYGSSNWVLLETLIKLKLSHNDNLFRKLIPQLLDIMNDFDIYGNGSYDRNGFRSRVLEILKIN